VTNNENEMSEEEISDMQEELYALREAYRVSVEYVDRLRTKLEEVKQLMKETDDKCIPR